MIRRTSQSGQETLQAILVVAFVLLPVLAGIFVFGSLIHLYIGEQAAAAAGARAAGAAGGFGPEQYSLVEADLQENGVDPAPCSVVPSALEVSLNQPVSVTVSCPQRVGIPFLLERDVQLQSTFVARGEINQ